MAIKKSALYSHLWRSCDELRGGMDASQYKDYVLTLLFIKYVSDKYAKMAFPPIKVSKGATFQDMVDLKGKTDIGKRINTEIIGKLELDNKISGMPDFDDDAKLGTGKEKVERLTNLIAIFQHPALDFSRNRAGGDDILGDAYEYLMRHFATESGKSKGQFYTPAEVSRLLARLIGIREGKPTAKTSVYDPTCGSGSLLLKVADEAGVAISLYGQEMDSTTSTLARMNTILHNYPDAEIVQGNTLANPRFMEGGKLRTFDYVVSNPPFSSKNWSNGVSTDKDPHERFAGFGVPPEKNGDYAFLLHILRSLKSTGRGAVILPHGVLFRGNAEAEIRRNLLQRGLIEGIIGLPANLFYGTGIPACIIVLDKRHAATRKSVFMVDASKGYLKDGNKNRLREQDLHRIVDVWRSRRDVPGYSRLVPIEEITGPRNDHNLNLPRYIESTEREDVQDLHGHLHGGIPLADVDALAHYWKVYPSLRKALFIPRKGSAAHLDLTVPEAEIRTTIYQHPKFEHHAREMRTLVQRWRVDAASLLSDLDAGLDPNEVIGEMAENLLELLAPSPLLDPYAAYQHLMDYWAETLQDDLYTLSDQGWEAGQEVKRMMREVKPSKKQGEQKEGKQQVARPITGLDGLEGTLIPVPLLVRVMYAQEERALQEMQARREAAESRLDELLESAAESEDSPLTEVMDDGKVQGRLVKKRLKDLGKRTKANAEQWDSLTEWVKLEEEKAQLAKDIKAAEQELEKLVEARYPKLTLQEIQMLVIHRKWMDTVEGRIHAELDRISQRLAQRLRELAQRYAKPLPVLEEEVKVLEKKVKAHLKRMGVL